MRERPWVLMLHQSFIPEKVWGLEGGKCLNPMTHTRIASVYKPYCHVKFPTPYFTYRAVLIATASPAGDVGKLSEEVCAQDSENWSTFLRQQSSS